MEKTELVKKISHRIFGEILKDLEENKIDVKDYFSIIVSSLSVIMSMCFQAENANKEFIDDVFIAVKKKVYGDFNVKE